MLILIHTSAQQEIVFLRSCCRGENTQYFFTRPTQRLGLRFSVEFGNASYSFTVCFGGEMKTYATCSRTSHMLMGKVCKGVRTRLLSSASPFLAPHWDTPRTFGYKGASFTRKEPEDNKFCSRQGYRICYQRTENFSFNGHIQLKLVAIVIIYVYWLFTDIYYLLFINVANHINLLVITAMHSYIHH